MAFAACGGQTVDDAGVGIPVGSNTGSPDNPPGGAACLGMPVSAGSTACYSLPIAVIPADTNPDCEVPLEIASGFVLDVTRIKLFFSASSERRYEIPHVTTVADCASATTYGGWYATDPVNGITNVVLCGCSCEYAHKKPMTVDVSCS